MNPSPSPPSDAHKQEINCVHTRRHPVAASPTDISHRGANTERERTNALTEKGRRVRSERGRRMRVGLSTRWVALAEESRARLSAMNGRLLSSAGEQRPSERERERDRASQTKLGGKPTRAHRPHTRLNFYPPPPSPPSTLPTQPKEDYDLQLRSPSRGSSS